MEAQMLSGAPCHLTVVWNVYDADGHHIASPGIGFSPGDTDPLPKQFDVSNARGGSLDFRIFVDPTVLFCGLLTPPGCITNITVDHLFTTWLPLPGAMASTCINVYNGSVPAPAPTPPPAAPPPGGSGPTTQSCENCSLIAQILSSVRRTLP
jgi:hypothetical protein